jgi:hypothetical protein
VNTFLQSALEFHRQIFDAFRQSLHVAWRIADARFPIGEAEALLTELAAYVDQLPSTWSMKADPRMTLFRKARLLGKSSLESVLIPEPPFANPSIQCANRYASYHDAAFSLVCDFTSSMPLDIWLIEQEHRLDPTELHFCDRMPVERVGLESSHWVRLRSIEFEYEAGMLSEASYMFGDQDLHSLYSLPRDVEGYAQQRVDRPAKPLCCGVEMKPNGTKRGRGFTDRYYKCTECAKTTSVSTQH